MTTALAWIGGIFAALAIAVLAAVGTLLWLFRDPNTFR